MPTKKPRKKMTPQTTADEAPRPRGRPPGTTIDPELRKSEMVHVRVTPAQKLKWDSMPDADDRFRSWLDRVKLK